MDLRPAKQDNYCCQKLDQGNERERQLIIGSHVTHRANDCRCECKYPLVDRDNQRHRGGDIRAFEFFLYDQWRERGQIADSETEENASKRESHRSATENQQQDTADLHGKVGGSGEPAIMLTNPLAGCGPANDGTYRCQADKKPGMLNSKLRRKTSHQVGKQADLRKESERESCRNRDETPALNDLDAGPSRLRPRARLMRRLAVWR
ncbi:hypothetical protein V1279_003424 [Bradyrhizobium sp. AZCC 1610]